MVSQPRRDRSDEAGGDGRGGPGPAQHQPGRPSSGQSRLGLLIHVFLLTYIKI